MRKEISWWLSPFVSPAKVVVRNAFEKTFVFSNKKKRLNTLYRRWWVANETIVQFTVSLSWRATLLKYPSAVWWQVAGRETWFQLTKNEKSKKCKNVDRQQSFSVPNFSQIKKEKECETKNGSEGWKAADKEKSWATRMMSVWNKK